MPTAQKLNTIEPHVAWQLVSLLAPHNVQIPAVQVGVLPVHVLPQLPQLFVSVAMSTQAPESPHRSVLGAEQGPPEEVVPLPYLVHGLSCGHEFRRKAHVGVSPSEFASPARAPLGD
jgi:hypothetical protein